MPPPPLPGIQPNNPLAQPGQPLSGAALIQAAQALANAQTAGPLQELAKTIAQQQSQTTGAVNQVGGYFNQLGQLGQQGVTSQQNIASGLNAQLAQIAQDEQGRLGQIGQNATNSLLQYSPQASANTTNPGLQGLTQELARQSGLAAQQQGALRGFGAIQGANYGGLAASNLGTIGLRGQEDLTNIAQAGQVKNEPLMSKVAALNASKGAIFSTDLGKLRQQEITNAISQAGLGIKAQAANTAATTAAFNINPNAPGSPAYTRAYNANPTAPGSPANKNVTGGDPNAVGSTAWARVQTASGKSWSSNPAAVGSPAWARVQTANAKANGGAAKPLTTPENSHFWQTMGQIEGLIKEGQQVLIDPATGKTTTDTSVGKHPTEQQLRGALQSGSNSSKKAFDPFLIQVAYELLGYNGSINQSTAATLHNQYGVRGGTYNGAPIKVTPNYSPTNPAQNPPQPGLPGVIPTIGSAVQGAFGG